MCPDFKGKTSRKIGLRLENAQFSRALSGDFPICCLTVGTSPFHHSGSKYSLLLKN